VELALRITHALAADGITTDPDAARRTAQVFELAIDALDPAAIRPFWVAVLGYGDEPRNPGSDKPIMDPYEQGPTIWFQVMDAPRPQRNRIHFDLAVSPDQARPRIDAAVAAGGRVVSDAAAPAFWVLADPEGNEVCVCTWEGRD
jgi:4a-hydroxytetrahydrobiopterin dehydratase